MLSGNLQNWTFNPAEPLATNHQYGQKFIATYKWNTEVKAVLHLFNRLPADFSDAEKVNFPQRLEQICRLGGRYVERVVDVDVGVGHMLDADVDRWGPDTSLKRWPFIISEIPSGQPLTRFRLSIQEAFVCIKQAAEGLIEMHENSISHLCICPQNMLYTPDQSGNKPGLILANCHPWEGMVNRYSQTFHHRLAAEQYDVHRGQPALSVDIYQLAICVYEAFTEKTPFYHRRTAQGLRDAILSGDFQLDLDCPQVSRVLRKALDPYPENRFTSVHSFMYDLELALEEDRVFRRFGHKPAALYSRRQFIWKGGVALALTGVGWLVGKNIVNTQRLQSTIDRGTAIQQFSAPSEQIQAVAVVQNGAQIAWGSSSGQISVGDVASGSVSRSLVIPTKTPLVALTSSADGHDLVGCDSTGLLSVWDASTGKGLTSYLVAQSPHALALSGSEKYLLVSDQGKVRVFTNTLTTHHTNQPVSIYRDHNANRINSLAISPDGLQAASAASDGVQLWHLPTASPFYAYTQHSGEVLAVTYAANGQWIASGGVDKNVRIWQAIDAPGALVLSYPHSVPICALAFSADSRYIASGDASGLVYVYDVNNGVIVYTYRGHTEAVIFLAWSSDGENIISATPHEIRVWRFKQ